MRRFFSIYPRVFYPSFIVIAAFVIIVITGGEGIRLFFESFYKQITTYTSWLFVIGVNIFFFVCLWIAFGKYGKYRLGGTDSRPEFNLFSWLSMLFSAGMGIGLLYFSVFEPISHFTNPPMATDSNHENAIQALTFTFFHWGLHGWAIFCIVGLAIGYYAFNKKLPFSIRSLFFPLLGKRIYSIWGDIIDIVAVVTTLFGVATSLGFGSSQIATGLNYLFEIESDLTNKILIITVITIIATISVATGLRKGILFLSRLNIIIATIFLVVILLLSDTFGIIRIFTESTGEYLSRFIELGTWSSAFIDPTWQNEWTIFYWGWWIAWAPFVGMFIARISRGRTIQEFILGALFVPTFLTFFWFSTLGGSALQLELQMPGIISTEVMKDSSTSLFIFLEQFPWASITSFVSMLMITIFFVTSSDSGSLVIDSISAGGKITASVGQRIIWSLTEGAVAIALLVGGGLNAMQVANVSSGILFLLLLFLVTFLLIRSIRRLHRKTVSKIR
ncbi:MAG: BCCT family transporter [Flavobacteriaceae bacterium]|nr:BCCT family transporter [Flavobacteriaceae bacterium]